jgi:hypothetical protein
MTTIEFASRPRVQRWVRCLYQAGAAASPTNDRDVADQQFRNALVLLKLDGVYERMTQAHPLFREAFDGGRG